MVNMTVISLKDILKILFKIGLLIGIIYSIRYFFIDINNKNVDITDNLKQTTMQVYESSLISTIDTGMPIINQYNNDNKTTTRNSSVSRFMNMELGFVDYIIQNTDLEIVEEELTQDDTDELLGQIVENAETQIINENNIKTNYTNVYQTVEIRNESDYALTEEMLIPDYTLSNNKDILLFHTHTCESYTKTDLYNYESSREL